MISSKDIEDTYLTELVSVNKFYRLSTKIEMKYVHALKRHLLLANRKFDNSTKKDLFVKAYGFRNMYTKGSNFNHTNFKVDGY